jgi:hypothetical protein
MSGKELYSGDQDNRPQLSTYPCPVCDGVDFEWGTPGSEGGVYFVPEGGLFGFGSGQGLWARKCLNCGNVLLFIKRIS